MSKIPQQKDNFLRFICFFVDVGTEIVLKVFYYYHHQHPSVVTFPIPRTQPFAKQLQTVFFKSQYYNVTNATSPDDFDINTLITLLRTLFSGVLPTPTYGWGRHPASGDYSISADLLRLRSIRNDIVAHINRASLSSTVFENLWKTIEEILKRLVQKVDPANEAKLEETFEAYRQKTIGASTAEKYVDCLKKQLDELKQTLKDFILLWKDKQDTPFLRYIKLLIDGGRSILTAYLNKLVKDNNASLHNTLLERQASVLEELGDNQAIIEQVYQIGTEDVKTVNTETKNWDISVLAKVIECIFATYVDEDDLDAIKAIREARENYANTALRGITSDKRFHDECEDLMLNLSHLARSIGGNSKTEFKRFKDEYRSPSFQMTSDEIDIYLNQLKWPGLDIKDINEIHRECVEKLRAELSAAVNIDVNVKENFELEIMFEIACQDNENQKEAESILYKFMKAILENPVLETVEGPDFPEIRQTLDTIKGIPTVRLTCVKKSCILVTVDCNSRQALISLVDYIDSSMFQNQLDDISIELKDIFDEVFISKGHFTLESIQKTLVLLGEKLSENNSVVHDDESAQTTEIIDTYEHMKKDTLSDIPSIRRFGKLILKVEPEMEKERTELIQRETDHLAQKIRNLTSAKFDLKWELKLEKERSERFKLENVQLNRKIMELTSAPVQLKTEVESEKERSALSKLETIRLEQEKMKLESEPFDPKEKLPMDVELSEQFERETLRLERKLMKLESASDPSFRKLQYMLEKERDGSRRIKLENFKLEKEKMELVSSLRLAEKKLAELELERSEEKHSSKQSFTYV